MSSNKTRLLADPILAAKVEAILDEIGGGYHIELMEARASDKQVEFQAAFLSHEYDTYAAMGANRSGKSVVAGELCFAKHLRDVARDGDLFWCVAPTSEKSLGQQKLLWKTLPKFMFNGFEFDEKNGFDGQRPIITMKLPNGRGHCVINFKNTEQRGATFEQDAVNGVWCDEHLPYEYYQRLIPRCIDKRGWILYSDIPEQDWHWFELFNAPKDAHVFCRVFAMDDNRHNLPDGAIERASARLSKEERDMRIFGKFRRLSGVVFKEFDRDRHLVASFGIPSEGPYPSETNWPRWRLCDYGGSSPTAGLWVAIAPNECAYFYREYYQRYGNVRVHAHAMRDASLLADGRAEEYVGGLMDPHAWDYSPANEINIAQQYALEGIEFSPWPYMNVFGERAAVEIMKRRFEVDQIKVMAHLVEFIRELGAWAYEVDAEGNPKASDVYQKKNNHLIDCAKGFFATRPCFTVPQIRRKR